MDKREVTCFVLVKKRSALRAAACDPTSVCVPPLRDGPGACSAVQRRATSAFLQQLEMVKEEKSTGSSYET